MSTLAGRVEGPYSDRGDDKSNPKGGFSVAVRGEEGGRKAGSVDGLMLTEESRGSEEANSL